MRDPSNAFSTPSRVLFLLFPRLIFKEERKFEMVIGFAHNPTRPGPFPSRNQVTSEICHVYFCDFGFLTRLQVNKHDDTPKKIY